MIFKPSKIFTEYRYFKYSFMVQKNIGLKKYNNSYLSILERGKIKINPDNQAVSREIQAQKTSVGQQKIILIVLQVGQ